MKIKKFLFLPLCCLALASCAGSNFKEEFESRPTADIDDYLENVKEVYNYSSKKYLEKTTSYTELLPDENNLDYGLYLTTDSNNKCTAISLITGKQLFTGIDSNNIDITRNRYLGFNIVIRTDDDKYYLIDPYGNKTPEYNQNITNITISELTGTDTSIYGSNQTVKLMLSYVCNNNTYRYIYNNYKLEEYKPDIYQNESHQEYDLSICGYDGETVVVDKTNNGYKFTYKVEGKDDKVYTRGEVELSGLVGRTVIAWGKEAVTQFDDYNFVDEDGQHNPIYLKTYIEKINLKSGNIKKEYTKDIPTSIRFISEDLYQVEITHFDKDYSYDKLIFVDEDYDVVDTKVNDYSFSFSSSAKYSYTKVNDNYYNKTTGYLVDNKSNVITSLEQYKSVNLIEDFNLFICKNHDNYYGVIDSNGIIKSNFVYTSYSTNYKFGYIYLKDDNDNWFKLDSEGTITPVYFNSLNNYYYYDDNKNLKTLLNNDLGQFEKFNISSVNFHYYDLNNDSTYYIYLCSGINTSNMDTSKLFICCNEFKKEVKQS